MDTAPTGHTLLLLDATGAYHRAGIEPWAWIVNNRVAAAHPHSPLLRHRARNEFRKIDAVATQHARRHAVVPLLTKEPVGVERLRALAKRKIS